MALAKGNTPHEVPLYGGVTDLAALRYAESEISKLKGWMRKKYGSIRGHARPEDEVDQNLASKVDEYMFLSNIGSSMDDIMEALHFANGGKHRARDI